MRAHQYAHHWYQYQISVIKSVIGANDHSGGSTLISGFKKTNWKKNFVENIAVKKFSALFGSLCSNIKVICYIKVPSDASWCENVPSINM